MNDILKQRLVGALILVALGVIFWPIIFVEPGDREAAQQRPVPPRPGVAAEPVAPPDEAGLRASRERVAAEYAQSLDPELDESAAAAAEPGPEPEPEPEAELEPESEAGAAPEPEPEVTATVEPRSEPPQPLALDADGVPVSWVLQVASVSSATKADELRGKLLDMGHKAYVQAVERGGRTLYRVYVGPRFEREQLERAQSQIDAAFGVKSMVSRYSP